jgi:hypothetical protein
MSMHDGRVSVRVSDEAVLQASLNAHKHRAMPEQAVKTKAGLEQKETTESKGHFSILKLISG